MRVLIVEHTAELAEIWRRHLERSGAEVCVASGEQAAIGVLRHTPVDVIVLDLMLADGSPIAVADYASYRYPEAKVVFVTNRTFFSDGSIFNHIPNACAFIRQATPPDDLTAIVEYHGAR